LTKRKNIKRSYLIIQDDDKKLFNCFEAYDSSVWQKKIVDAQKMGRNVSCFHADVEQVKDRKNFMSEFGFTLTEDYLV
jgi:hypothetical protein